MQCCPCAPALRPPVSRQRAGIVPARGREPHRESTAPGEATRRVRRGRRAAHRPPAQAQVTPGPGWEAGRCSCPCWKSPQPPSLRSSPLGAPPHPGGRSRTRSSPCSDSISPSAKRGNLPLHSHETSDHGELRAVLGLRNPPGGGSMPLSESPVHGTQDTCTGQPPPSGSSGVSRIPSPGPSVHCRAPIDPSTDRRHTARPGRGGDTVLFSHIYPRPLPETF